jgi:hypothetical protein
MSQIPPCLEHVLKPPVPQRSRVTNPHTRRYSDIAGNQEHVLGTYELFLEHQIAFQYLPKTHRAKTKFSIFSADVPNTLWGIAGKKPQVGSGAFKLLKTCFVFKKR